MLQKHTGLEQKQNVLAKLSTFLCSEILSYSLNLRNFKESGQDKALPTLTSDQRQSESLLKGLQTQKEANALECGLKSTEQVQNT